MEWLNLALALGLLWLPTLAWLNWLVPSGVSGRPALVNGYALLAGLIGVPLLLRALYFLEVQAVFATAVAALIGFGLIGLALGRRAGPVSSDHPSTPVAETPVLRWLFLLCAALLTLRLGLLASEVALRPLQPWDALMHWGTKAKVWLANGELSPFVHGYEWLALDGREVYTDNHPYYPRTIPLLQVWAGLAIGGWHDSLVNTPWLLMWMALGLICFGQLRYAGSPPWLAMAGSYMLLSVPLINQQVALAGYADLLLGLLFLAACAAFYHWSVTREPWQGMLALLSALACLLVKNEGLFWLACFLPGLIVALLPTRKAVALLALSGLLALAALVLVPEDLRIAGHTLRELDLFYREFVLSHLFEGLFVHASWHLGPTLALIGLPLAVWLAGDLRQRLLPLGTVVAAAIVLFLVLFTMTRYAPGAVRYTALNRIALHLFPALWFLLLAGIELARQWQSKENKYLRSREGVPA